MNILPLFSLAFTFLLTSPSSVLDKDGKQTREPLSDLSPHAGAPLALDASIRKVVLKTANGCGIGNFIIPCAGDTSLGTPPTVGVLWEPFPYENYKAMDTLPGTEIKGVAFVHAVWPPNTSIISTLSPADKYVVVTDAGMVSYWIDWDLTPWSGELHRIDSLALPGIIRMAEHTTVDTTNPILLLTADTLSPFRVRAYAFSTLTESFSFPLEMEPELFEVYQDAIFISGRDTAGAYHLFHHSTADGSLLATYLLNDSASAAQEIISIGDSLYLLSSPGDSMVTLTTVHVLDSTFTQQTVYVGAGARATYNDYQNEPDFTFQPSDTLLGRQILRLDPPTGSYQDTLIVDQELNVFKYPAPEFGGFGIFSMGWIGARWNGGGNDSVFLSDAFLTSVMKVKAGGMPQYIDATWGCWAGLPKSELDKIKIQVHPNPATAEATISISGMERGKPYTLTVTDLTGKLLFSTPVEAYQELSLPVGEFAPGVYFLNLDTGQNLISRKLVVQ